MKFKGLFIDWCTGLANDPDIYFTIDKFPNKEDEIWNEIPLGNGHTYYYSGQEGILRAFEHNPRNEKGFGGHVFKLKMADGTIREVKGPWDVGTRQANKLLGGHGFVSVALNDNPKMTVYTAYMMNYETCQAALYHFDIRLTLGLRDTSITGLGDEQSEVILHGSETKPDSYILYLNKGIRQLVGYETKKGNWGFDMEYSVWGNSIRR